jgi:hypothetical protein
VTNSTQQNAFNGAQSTGVGVIYDALGNPRVIGAQMPVGAGSGKVVTSDASGNLTLQSIGSAGVLLKANNLSDVASTAASFANISPLTTAGDLIIESAAPAPARLAAGNAGQYLGVSGGLPAWVNPQSVISLPTAPSGALAETYTRYLVTSSTGIPTSGQLNLTAIGLPAGLTVTNITMATGGQAKTGGTHGWYCILDSSFVLRATSADQTDAATVWGTINTAYTLAMQTPYVTTYAGLYYLGVMVTESAGQMPTFSCCATLLAGVLSSPLPGGPSTGSLTTPGTPGTTTYAAPSSTGRPQYGYVS